jgi:microcin C transport system substrate-binding protein
MIGIKNPVIDAIVDKVITAPDRAALIDRVHALDRVLLSQYYVIPNWYIGKHRVAWWNRFGRPAVQPIYGSPGFPERWWVEKETTTNLGKP